MWVVHGAFLMYNKEEFLDLEDIDSDVSLDRLVIPHLIEVYIDSSVIIHDQ